jgi:hypothetical protein
MDNAPVFRHEKAGREPDPGFQVAPPLWLVLKVK